MKHVSIFEIQTRKGLSSRQEKLLAVRFDTQDHTRLTPVAAYYVIISLTAPVISLPSVLELHDLSILPIEWQQRARFSPKSPITNDVSQVFANAGTTVRESSEDLRGWSLRGPWSQPPRASRVATILVFGEGHSQMNRSHSGVVAEMRFRSSDRARPTRATVTFCRR